MVDESAAGGGNAHSMDNAQVGADLVHLSVQPPAVTSGGGPLPVGIVTLSAPAPTGGVLITLASDQPEVASVPPNVHVPEGTSITFFSIDLAPVHQASTVTI